MGKTPIEWTDETWNPIRGTKGRWHCTHVSEGCRNCYAERINRRWGGPEYKPGADTFRIDEKILRQPLHWRQPRKVFVCDMTDLFHQDIPLEWIERVHGHMMACKQATFQVLTKRPTRMLEYFTAFHASRGRSDCMFEPRRNIWPGVSVEDQQTADERIPLLLQTPAAVRFVSYEPALGPVDFSQWIKPIEFASCWERGYEPTEKDRKAVAALAKSAAKKAGWPRIDWLIIGGESGYHSRPCYMGWILSAIQQCQKAKIPVFLKQLGSNARTDLRLPLPGMIVHDGKVQLKHPKGGDPSEWPEELRVREWPTTS